MKWVFFLSLFLASCGIRGNPIPPSQTMPKDNTLLKKTEQKAPFEDSIIIPKNTLDRVGHFYNADFGDNTEELDDLFDKLRVQLSSF